MITTVKVKLDKLDSSKEKRLRQILSRDTRIICRATNLIHENRKTLVQKRRYGKYYIRRKDMNSLFVSTHKRTEVKHDLKGEFIRISHNELVECLDTAKEMYLSYLELGKQQKTSLPTLNGNYIPRSIGYRRFNLELKKKQIKIIDSYDTNLDISLGNKIKTSHDRLSLQLRLSDYHIEKIQKGKPKTVRIYKHKKEYWVSIAVDIDVEEKTIPASNKLAVLGIDLGISKAVTTALITTRGVVESKTFNKPDLMKKFERIDYNIGQIKRQTRIRDIARVYDIIDFRSKKIDNRIINDRCKRLLRKLKSYDKSKITYSKFSDFITGFLPDLNKFVVENINNYEKKKQKDHLIKLNHILVELGLNVEKFGKVDGLYKRLRKLSHKRALIKQDIDRKIASEVAEYVDKLSDTFDIYISIGKVSGIRKRNYRGNGNKWLRKKVHLWSFGRFTEQFRHNLKKVGLVSRLIEVKESWTSIFCFKCNKRGTRPKQNRFVCRNHRCKIKNINADKNAAINIAKRGIKYKKLVNKSEYYLYNIPLKKKKKRSKMNRKSTEIQLNLFPKQSTQKSLEDFF